MTWQYILTALIGVAISASAICVCRFFKKKWVTPVACFAAICPMLGYIIMLFSDDIFTFFDMVKTMTIWGFVLFMILINAKCLIFGTKRDVRRGKGYFSVLKASMYETKKIFKKDASATGNDNDETEKHD